MNFSIESDGDWALKKELKRLAVAGRTTIGSMPNLEVKHIFAGRTAE